MVLKQGKKTVSTVGNQVSKGQARRNAWLERRKALEERNRMVGERKQRADWVVSRLFELSSTGTAGLADKEKTGLHGALFRMFRERKGRNPETPDEIIRELRMPLSFKPVIEKIMKP